MRYLLLLLLFPLLYCSHKREPTVNPDLLINKLWIHNLTIDSTAVFPLNHQLIWEFDSVSLYQNSGQIGAYAIMGDTLTIFETDPNQKDPLLKEIYFEARIQKLTADSLQLLSLVDNSYFRNKQVIRFYHEQVIRFYHEQLNYDPSLVIHKIILSTSDCSLGECPVMKVELLPDKSIYFEGIANTKQFQGKFQGKVVDSIYSRIENNLRLTNLSTIDTLLPYIIDGQDFELVIYFNNNQQKKIKGGVNHFFTNRNDIKDVAGYRRLQGAVYLLSRLYLNTPLKNLREQNKILPPHENSEK